MRNKQEERHQRFLEEEAQSEIDLHVGKLAYDVIVSWMTAGLNRQLLLTIWACDGTDAERQGREEGAKLWNVPAADIKVACAIRSENSPPTW